MELTNNQITRRATIFGTPRDTYTEDQVSGELIVSNFCADLIYTANFPALTDDENLRQDALLAFIAGDNLIKHSLANATIWYTRFLRQKFLHQWPLLAKSLNKLDSKSATPNKGDLVVVYDFLMTVGLRLKTQCDLTLAGIIDELEFKDQLKDQDDGERALQN